MLKQDQPLQTVLGSRAVPSSDAMGDWLRRVGEEGLPGAGRILAKANALFFRLGILAYNMFVGFKRLCCPQGWVQHTIATVRWRLLHVAGQVVYHARKLVLRLRVSSEKMRVYEYIVERIAALSNCYAH